MRKSKIPLYAAGCVGMGLLILDSKTALAGANEGIRLAVTVLIPSLFPFLFLSIWLTSAFQGMRIPLLKPFSRFFSIPDGTEALLIPAFLGGYPTGAQAVRQSYRSGSLSKENGEKMLSFCSNAGPSFLFGMAASCFSKKWMVWLLWLFHILGALAAARMYPCSKNMPAALPQQSSPSITGILKQALSVMSVICGWVILFRVVIAFADRWFLWLLPPELRTGLIGLLELSNGICELNAIADEKLRFLICSGILSLGGICITLQTHSVTEGLEKKYYYRGKMIQLLVSVCCGAAHMYHPAFILPILLLLLPKIRSGNPAAISV